MSFKILIFLLVWFCIDVSNFEKISKNKTGYVKLIEFDSDGNTYVYMSEILEDRWAKAVPKLYKFNSKKEIVLEIKVENLKKILITATNFVYAISINEYNKEIEIYFLRPNSTNLARIAKYNNDFFNSPNVPLIFFNDKNGGLIFNAPYGVAMFKLGESVPVSILNLENFYGYSYLVDSANNVFISGVQYLADGLYKQSFNVVGFISSEDLGKIIPTARTRITSENRLSMEPFSISEHENLLILGYNGNHARFLAMEKDSPTEPKVLHAQPFFKYVHFLATKDYFYFFGKSGDVCFLSYLSDKYQIVNGSEEGLCASSDVLYDEGEYIYFASKTRLCVLKVGEKEVQEFKPVSGNSISLSALDEQGDLYILGEKKLYVLKKHGKEIVMVANVDNVLPNRVLKINKYTKEIFVGSDSGLYVFGK